MPGCALDTSRNRREIAVLHAHFRASRALNPALDSGLGDGRPPGRGRSSRHRRRTLERSAGIAARCSFRDLRETRLFPSLPNNSTGPTGGATGRRQFVLRCPLGGRQAPKTVMCCGTVLERRPTESTWRSARVSLHRSVMESTWPQHLCAVR